MKVSENSKSIERIWQDKSSWWDLQRKNLVRILRILKGFDNASQIHDICKPCKNVCIQRFTLDVCSISL